MVVQISIDFVMFFSLADVLIFMVKRNDRDVLRVHL